MDVMDHANLPNNLHVDAVACIVVGVGCYSTMAIQDNDEAKCEEEHQLVEEHHHLVVDKVHQRQQQRQQRHSLDDDHSNYRLHRVDSQWWEVLVEAQWEVEVVLLVEEDSLQANEIGRWDDD